MLAKVSNPKLSVLKPGNSLISQITYKVQKGHQVNIEVFYPVHSKSMLLKPTLNQNFHFVHLGTTISVRPGEGL